MKTLLILVATLTTLTLPAQSQILGIFQQGAEELSESDQQLAALALLLTRQQNGYHIIESGLTSIDTITGNEFNLHRNYYTSLATVNPAITQTPESTAFLSIESQIINESSAALSRWRQSQYLTSSDLAYVTRMSSVIASIATLQLSTFNMLTSNSNLTMTDDQRVEMIYQNDQQARSLFNFYQSLITSVDLLILDRRN
jgi:hypothetical protein